MRRTGTLISLGLLAGCSFIDDFDKFRGVDAVLPADDAGDRDPRDDAGAVPDGAAPDGARLDSGGPDADVDASSDAYVPPPVCAGQVCDDGDPCTADACDNNDGCKSTVIDADADGYSPGTCKAGSSARGGDCDDGNKEVHPGATELCDELDNDCVKGVDDGFTKTQCYPDLDRDGYANLDGRPLAVCANCPEFSLAVTDPSDRAQHDCWDDPDTRGEYVFPRQSNFYDEGYGPGGKNDRKWDYDCSGVVEMQYKRQVGLCGPLLNLLLCSGEIGFVDNPIPGCGESGKFQTCGSNGLSCVGVEDTRRQLCH
ncbi:MAG TPA: putative metal-binding motif-containing protein [Polyangiales bacterium]